MKAFSLIEMLVVMAVIALMSAFAMVGFSNVQRGSDITRYGSLVADSITYARQKASTRNRLVEVRFITRSDSMVPSGMSCNAFQVWIADANGGNFAPESAAIHFDRGIEIDDASSLSPLLNRTNGVTNFAALGNNLSWKGFRFRPNGSLDGAIAGTNFITLHHFRDAGVPPVNYFAIRVDPSTGRVTTYRP